MTEIDDNVIDMFAWDTNRKAEAIRKFFDAYREAMTGKYRAIFKTRAGFLKEEFFSGYPPVRWRYPIPARMTLSMQALPETFHPIECMEFELVKIVKDVLYYEER